jgi:alpha 1,2-mannosyltransferase
VLFSASILEMKLNMRVLIPLILAMVLLQIVVYYMLPLREQRCFGKNRNDFFEGRANAAILILVRNNELAGLQSTIPQFEYRFNHRYNYPYIFLNDEPFTDYFKREVRKLSNSRMSFGTIPEEHWSYPSWIDIKLADRKRAEMKYNNVMYGGSLSYRHMCRFNSGFFFRNSLLDDYEYYWRVEPYTEFTCDIEYDPFMFMKKNKKKYGFTILLHENDDTIPTLWETTKQFMEENRHIVKKDNSLELVQNSNGSYNLCHFWSNFEIASLDLWRSPEYIKYFEYLDRKGGFFYERWGDAPVHSLFVAMFLSSDEIHHFEDIGYYHSPYHNCPLNPALQLRCDCDPYGKLNYGQNHKCFYYYQNMLNSKKI